MKEKSASLTAEDMAGYRAMEMLRPEEDRVCEDPFAKYFLSGSWEKRYKAPIRGKIYLWLGNLYNPGGSNAVAARATFIAEYIKTCLADGIEQLVILGAGYDCRAYRMEELKTGVGIFEVDHPATQDQKKRILNRVCNGMPNSVGFVPCRLEDNGIGEQLIERGYDKSKKSLFIMEGLIMYLDPEAVRKLFYFISELCCPDSAVVFDFLPPGIEDGTISNRGGKNMYSWGKKRGEPFKFGIEKRHLPQFLSEIGFNDIKVIAAEQCRNKYFKGASRKRSISPLFSFAHATVRSIRLLKNGVKYPDATSPRLRRHNYGVLASGQSSTQRATPAVVQSVASLSEGIILVFQQPAKGNGS